MIQQQKVLMGLALVLLVLLAARTLSRRNASIHSALNLDDLLLGEDGKLSKAAAVMMGSFALTSWVVVYQTLNGKISDILFGAYCATWAAPAVAKIFAGRPAENAATTETKIETKTVTPQP